MRRFLLALMAVAAFSTSGFAQNAEAPGTSKLPHAILTKPYVAALGDLIALTMSQAMPVVRATLSGIDAPMVFAYNRESQKIVVSIYGDPTRTEVFRQSPTPVDHAKGALEMFREKVLPLLTGFVAQAYGVNLIDSDLTLIYFDRADGMREIMRREGDKYLVHD